jgi:hypothetical protein
MTCGGSEGQTTQGALLPSGLNERPCEGHAARRVPRPARVAPCTVFCPL